VQFFDSFLSLHPLEIAMEKKTSKLTGLGDKRLKEGMPPISVLEAFGIVLPLNDD
jgi:hypothetical protein